MALQYLLVSLAGLTLVFGSCVSCAAAPNWFTVVGAGALGVAATIGLQGYWWSLREAEQPAFAVTSSILCAALGTALILGARVLWRDKEVA
jgi:hypothetical protein